MEGGKFWRVESVVGFNGGCLARGRAVEEEASSLAAWADAATRSGECR